jgi:hypothetical protein
MSHNLSSQHQVGNPPTGAGITRLHQWERLTVTTTVLSQQQAVISSTEVGVSGIHQYYRSMCLTTYHPIIRNPKRGVGVQNKLLISASVAQLQPQH